MLCPICPCLAVFLMLLRRPLIIACWPWRWLLARTQVDSNDDSNVPLLSFTIYIFFSDLLRRLSFLARGFLQNQSWLDESKSPQLANSVQGGVQGGSICSSCLRWEEPIVTSDSVSKRRASTSLKSLSQDEPGTYRQFPTMHSTSAQWWCKGCAIGIHWNRGNILKQNCNTCDLCVRWILMNLGDRSRFKPVTFAHQEVLQAWLQWFVHGQFMQWPVKNHRIMERKMQADLTVNLTPSFSLWWLSICDS